MQYTRIFFSLSKMMKFHWKCFDNFDIFAKNIDCGYTLEPLRRGGSNEYSQSMFWTKNKKNRHKLTVTRILLYKRFLRFYLWTCIRHGSEMWASIIPFSFIRKILHYD